MKTEFAKPPMYVGPSIALGFALAVILLAVVI